MSAPKGEKQITEFNSSISWLINLVRKLHPKNADIDRAASRISIAKQTDPTILIKMVGPYLERYSDDIIEYDDQFVLTMDISKQTNDVFVQTIFTLLTESYKGFKTKERDIVKDKINDMLNTYTEYRIAIG